MLIKITLPKMRTCRLQIWAMLHNWGVFAGLHALVLAYDLVGRMQDESEEMCASVCMCPFILFIVYSFQNKATQNLRNQEFCQHFAISIILLRLLVFFSFLSVIISLHVSCSSL